MRYKREIGRKKRSFWICLFVYLDATYQESRP